jgi:KipI family sensor histidine kinase inhibitor
VTIRPASDRSLLVSFGDAITLDVHHSVVRLLGALSGTKEVVNLHPGYASLLIDFDPRRHSLQQIENLVRKCIRSGPADSPEGKVWELPVRYGGIYGPDLEDVARLTGFSMDDVVTRHASAEYLVYFLGFSPGFPYLGGMSPELATPRMAAPRARVPAGSVAIGGPQTGVYPTDSPGGWRIIGRTEVALFDALKSPPALLSAGDRVHFIPVREH